LFCVSLLIIIIHHKKNHRDNQKLYKNNITYDMIYKLYRGVLKTEY